MGNSLCPVLNRYHYKRQLHTPDLNNEAAVSASTFSSDCLNFVGVIKIIQDNILD
jgi:hypothetical protein